MARYSSSEDDFGLSKGELQEPDNTLFVFDETKMDQGQLNDLGCRNIRALQNTIDSGIVEYETEFDPLLQKSDFSFLIVGNSKSLVNTSCVIPVISQHESNELSQDLTKTSLSDNNYECEMTQTEKNNDSILENLLYLQAEMKSNHFEIPEGMHSVIESDFVESQRQARASKESADNDGLRLSLRLTLAECIAKSFGKNKLDEESWKRSGVIEDSRMQRILKN